MATARELKQLCADDENFLVQMDSKERAPRRPKDPEEKKPPKELPKWLPKAAKVALLREKKLPKELPKKLPKAAKVALMRGSLVPICLAVQSCWNA
eukprot:COSAG02_NODE_332_length_24474_cov_23.190949_24_plen_96_part_00